MGVRRVRAIGCVSFALLLVVAVGVGAVTLLRHGTGASLIVAEDRCVVTAGGQSVVLDPDQAHYASIIVGVSVRRGLARGAGSIGVATAYHECGIRNLDYGDRDSVGLFQQRPSQGWGSARQLQDPYYATGKFYDALVKIKNWQTDNLNDVAQQVQRSGHPEAYRDHEADARIVASALTGHSPAGVTCLVHSTVTGTPRAMAASLQKTFGPVSTRSTATVLSVRAGSARLAWAYAHYAVANAQAAAVTQVTVGDRQWRQQTGDVPAWTPASPAVDAREVQITLRG